MREKNIKIVSSILIILLIAVCFVPTSFAKGTVRVKGYTTKNGTYVAPHVRTSPDKTTSNNWSTKGNINPYTGKEGTVEGKQNIGNKSNSQIEIKPSNVNLSTQQEKSKSDAISVNGSFFTMGSTASEVLNSNGSPSSITNSDYLKVYNYEYSTVYFDENWKVTSWSNVSKNLKVTLGTQELNAKPFTMGATATDVIKSNGTPDSITNSEYLKSYSYEYSTVYFDENWKVTSWSNISKNLNVTLETQKVSEKPFTMGSTASDVINSNGTPDTITNSKYLKSYSYMYSTVFFDENWKVESWSNISKNLKVTLGEQELNAKPFSLGSTALDVIKANGTPDSITNSKYLKSYSYMYSTVYFDENWKVTSWSNISKNLKVL